MKRFLLFGGTTTLKLGGWQDLASSFDLATDAIAAAKRLHLKWWHVVDSTTGHYIYHSDV